MEGAPYKIDALLSKFAFENCIESRSPSPIFYFFCYGLGFIFRSNFHTLQLKCIIIMRRSQQRGGYLSLTQILIPSHSYMPNRRMPKKLLFWTILNPRLHSII